MTVNFNANVKNFSETKKSLRAIQRAINSTLEDSIPGSFLKLDTSNDPLTGTLNAQEILPALDATFDLGSAILKWVEIHGVDGFFTGDVEVDGKDVIKWGALM